jgi:hypothetical protein
MDVLPSRCGFCGFHGGEHSYCVYPLTGLNGFNPEDSMNCCLLQDHSFIVAPSTAALSHGKPASAGTSREGGCAQDSEKNAL